MKPIAYYSKSQDYVCTPQERTELKLYKKYTIPLIPVQKPLSDEEIIKLWGSERYSETMINFAKKIEERHGIK